MTTEIELQQSIYPLDRPTPNGHVFTFPPLPQHGLNRALLATAPFIGNETLSGTRVDDVNGNLAETLSPVPLTSPTATLAIQLPEDVHHDLAKYLSSGDRQELNINQANVNSYLNIANNLNHKNLKRICNHFLNGNDCKTRTWENNSRICKLCLNVHDKHPSSTNKASVGTNPRVPSYEIMFPKDVHCSNSHKNVFVMDIRKHKEVHRIEQKKVTKFGDRFAVCAAYAKKCPYLFVSGGNGKTDRSLFKYDVVENKWSQCHHLKHPRSKHVMAFVQNCVYIIGGQESASIERYELENGHCSELRPNLPVRVHCAAHVVYNDKIFIFGGKTLRNEVQIVQCIDTKANSTSRLSDLPFPCSGGQAIVVKDKIYLATNHGHMIKYDPETGQSELCSQQPYNRKHFVMYEKNGYLHIFGGVRTDGKVEEEGTVYKFCPLGNEWKRSVSFGVPLPIHTSCTIVYPKECPVTPFRKMFGYC
ncbi:uncharacterized protein LOC128236408 [Mya arenaria]|nr:uncharacterized protein LOC128236408 [Mya arenaria]XP_052807216.1 uncharacterized protein LOC128236408 [Mya arenaria]XP_052807217.1 uncharacterized protein LOC128236408 [Mya arenaria]